MRKILLLGSVCLGGLLMASAGCGEKKPPVSTPDKPKPPDGKPDPGDGPGDGPGPGPAIDWVRACKADVVYDYFDMVCYGDSEEDRDDLIEELFRECEEDVEFAKEEQLYWCDTPDVEALESCAAFLKEAKDCDEMEEAYRQCHSLKRCDNKITNTNTQAELSEICTLESEYFIRLEACDPDIEEVTLSNERRWISNYAALCTEDVFVEQWLKFERSNCEKLNVDWYRDCTNAIRAAANDCKAREDADKNDCSNAFAWCLD